VHTKFGILPFVALGGALGTALRSVAIDARPDPPGAFPWTMLAVNVVGSMIAGALVAAVGNAPDRVRLRAVSITGGTGALTSFSTFAVGVVELADVGRVAAAAALVGATMTGCVAAAVVGHRVGSRFDRSRTTRLSQDPRETT
jgi:CrcB protein